MLNSLLMMVAEIRVDVVCASFQKIHFARSSEPADPIPGSATSGIQATLTWLGRGCWGPSTVPGGALAPSKPCWPQGPPTLSITHAESGEKDI